MNIKNLSQLQKLKNRKVEKIVKHYIDLCKPDKVTVLTDTPRDINYVRKLALKNKEETPLKTPGHTIHFDGFFDQGRDKEKTKVLLSGESKISKSINTGDRESCLEEIFSLLSGNMKGKEMLVSFYCLGPTDSPFSLPAMQITDSAYVAHSENMLYRQGFGEFKKLKGSDKFFYFIHSAGELENGVSKNSDKKRIYIDLEENRVFSVNTQYAGNSVGLKKLALRLAIKKSNESDWLCEHMLVLGAKPQGKKRITYFTGAFPSACGKTSTAMIPGQSIIGDDIAYLKRGKDGRCYAANVEQGIFGIIENVNPKDDPLIYKSLTTPKELIFSNVLINNKKPYWLGMGRALPDSGVNFAGHWKLGDKDGKDNPIPHAHKNARYTMRLSELTNVNPHLHDPSGVPISGIIYGGRDSDTTPPVVESFDWSHGVLMGAALESETTAATIGETGVRKHNPMANFDFLVVPLSTYINNHLAFGRKLKKKPTIFTTNYFLKEGDSYLNGKLDKKVWLMWMEGRIHGEFRAIKTPIGYLPKYEDLKKLFWDNLKQAYKKEDYRKQFHVRTGHLLAKLERIEAIFKIEPDIPKAMFVEIKKQRKRLK